MQEQGRSKVVVWVVAGIVAVAVFAFAVSFYVGQQARREQQERKQVEAEQSRLEYFELMERADNLLKRPSALTAAEQEEFRQLRERAAKRKIERGY